MVELERWETGVGVYAFKPRDIPDATLFERSVKDPEDMGGSDRSFLPKNCLLHLLRRNRRRRSRHCEHRTISRSRASAAIPAECD